MIPLAAESLGPGVALRGQSQFGCERYHHPSAPLPGLDIMLLGQLEGLHRCLRESRYHRCITGFQMRMLRDGFNEDGPLIGRER